MFVSLPSSFSKAMKIKCPWVRIEKNKRLWRQGQPYPEGSRTLTSRDPSSLPISDLLWCLQFTKSLLSEMIDLSMYLLHAPRGLGYSVKMYMALALPRLSFSLLPFFFFLYSLSCSFPFLSFFKKFNHEPSLLSTHLYSIHIAPLHGWPRRGTYFAIFKE